MLTAKQIEIAARELCNKRYRFADLNEPCGPNGQTRLSLVMDEIKAHEDMHNAIDFAKEFAQ